MSRINTNVPSLLAQRVLGSQNKALVTSLERLSTGLRINRGADDPAGLIASENLRAEKAAIASAISNAERAEQVVNVAEGGLQEISAMLIELQSLVGATANDAGVTAEEKEANQLQIDSILQTIDRVANATSFNGTKLLNGNFDYTTSSTTADAAKFDNISIQAARLSDAAGSFLNVTVDTQIKAETAGVFLSTGAKLDNGGNGSITIEVTGNEGVQQFTFASGSTQANVVSAINTFKDALGVSAAVGAGGQVDIHSTEYGSEQFVRVKILEGTTDTRISTTSGSAGTVTDLRQAGVDAVVLINGQSATAQGLKARVAGDGFDVTLDIDATGGLNAVNGSASFQITGGGADFNLAPSVNLSGKVSLGIQTVTTGNLGSTAAGFLSELKAGGTANVVNGDLTRAQGIIDKSIKQISSLRGRLGAFSKNTVGSTIRSLGVSLENTAAAESKIRDADFALETAELTRKQIITQAATQALAIANAQPQSVLSLLG
ncbi:MAG: flagellin N-terminal helical domain-containing protein [Planctomycetota bacterium]|jgi:flagellin